MSDNHNCGCGHDKVHSHDHNQGCGCGHNHGHDHAHTHHSTEETVALLSYMVDHNRHHGEDLHEIYHALKETNRFEAAELLHRAQHLYDEGNALLAQALDLLKS